MLNWPLPWTNWNIRTYRERSYSWEQPSAEWSASGQQREKKLNREDWETSGAVWELWELSGLDLSVSTTVYGPSTSVGVAAALCRCSRLCARSLQCIPRHITRAHFGSRKWAGSSELPHPPGFPTQSRCSLVGQCPRRHRRQLLQSCKTTQQPAQSPLLHKATFSRLGERAVLSNSYRTNIGSQSKWS